MMNDKFRGLLKKNPGLVEYLRQFHKATGTMPEFHETLGYSLRDRKTINVIYPLDEHVFAHVYMGKDAMKYTIIEQELTAEEDAKRKRLMDMVFRKAKYEKLPDTRAGFLKMIDKILNSLVTIVGGSRANFLERRTKIPLTKSEYAKISYHIKRDIVGVGIIDPILKDQYLEDLTAVGTDHMNIYHKIFGMLETNVRFKDAGESDDFMRHISERIGKPASVGTPIIDGTLPDGSRINIVYSDEISLRGPSFTIRRFTDDPLSVARLVDWNTLSAEASAYLWICLENKMSILACGATACGKTSTMNAMIPFIPYNAKIFTVEDTSEMKPPHDVWQQLLTRETGAEDIRVDSYELLKAAFRSRPDYIVLGEIRGREGAVAFQAMQSGHPVISTFHAETIAQMIQRLTSPPINIPLRFIDNLNVVLMQATVTVGGRVERRVTSIGEVIGYVREMDNVLAREVFRWNPHTDRHMFRGYHNSYVLETKISPALGYRDKHRIYEDLEIRRKIINAMIREGILSFHDVIKAIRAFQWHGIEGLWFPLT